jgi:hypothetical protein
MPEKNQEPERISNQKELATRKNQESRKKNFLIPAFRQISESTN